ncbi:MAG: phycobiliprotein lyase [Oscillatoriaceae cyanobacterium]
MDAMEFFNRSAGRWRSQRTTHHLAFRRAEMGDSEITVETLSPDHPRVVDICKLYEIDPQQASGGAFVRWEGSMAWDREGENHSGETVFAIVPDPENPKIGKMLRERGYAEIVPVAGTYFIDDEDALILETEYETMSAIERFWFANPDLRMRATTVKRFGGFSTASFCSESRIDTDAASANGNDKTATEPAATKQFYSLLGW